MTILSDFSKILTMAILTMTIMAIDGNSNDGNKGVEMKATLLAVTFLIDYLHFEADPGDSDGDED